MSRLNLSSISRFFSTSGSSRAETPRTDQPRQPAKSKPAPAGAALSQLSPREAHLPSTSSAASQRPRAQLPGAQKKKVRWTPDTPENGTLAALMDNERSTDVTKWGMGLRAPMKRHATDDPELQKIQDTIARNKRFEKAGMLVSDSDSDADSDFDAGSDSDSEIRPASHRSAVDVNAMLRQAGLLDE